MPPSISGTKYAFDKVLCHRLTRENEDFKILRLFKFPLAFHQNDVTKNMTDIKFNYAEKINECLKIERDTA